MKGKYGLKVFMKKEVHSALHFQSIGLTENQGFEGNKLIVIYLTVLSSLSGIQAPIRHEERIGVIRDEFLEGMVNIAA